MIEAMRMAIEEVLPTTTWREAPKSAYASSAAGVLVSTTCGGAPRRFGVGHRLRDDEHSHRQASDYDQAKPESLVRREPGPDKEIPAEPSSSCRAGGSRHLLHLRLHARTFCKLMLGTPFGRQNRPDEPEERNEDPDDPQHYVSLPESEQAHGEETENVDDDQERGEKPIEY